MEVLEHYPAECRCCGRQFSEDERQPSKRFGRQRVAELPPIAVIFCEHRTHHLRCRGCGDKTAAELPDGVGGSPLGPGLQAAVVTLTAA